MSTRFNFRVLNILQMVVELQVSLMNSALFDVHVTQTCFAFSKCFRNF